MQSYVLWALMQEILVKELAVERGSTAVSALESSAHFLCSRSDRVHHRNFFPAGSKKKSRFVGFHEKTPRFDTLWKREVILFYFNFPMALLCSLTPTHLEALKRCAHMWPRSLLPNLRKIFDVESLICVCFLLTESHQIVFGRFFKNQQLVW